MKGSTTELPIPVAWADSPGQEASGDDMAGLSREVAEKLATYLGPLLALLDSQMDARLVRTFAATIVNIVRHRNRALSLLLTELGELLTDGAHAPAGVKRLWRLLRSCRWTAAIIDGWVLSDAEEAVDRLVAEEGAAFLVLDGSGIEKPTACKLEGLTKVRSSTAALLQRASGGFPAKVPVMVPGFGWVAAVVTGMCGGLTLARLHWFSPKAPGEQAEKQREAERAVLGPVLERWGGKVVCLLDRGFDSHPFLGELLARAARFVVRWRGDFYLVGPDGEMAASRLGRRVRSKVKIEVYDARRRQWLAVGLVALPVRLPGHWAPLWLVIARRKGRQTWWFLTTEDASTEAGMIWVIKAYARRWQVEWAFRYGKSELGMASVRVRLWDYREKLWAMAELVYAFLLHLLVVDPALVRDILRWCHRTGRRWAQVIAPLYRLRHALANVWNYHPPTLVWPPG